MIINTMVNAINTTVVNKVNMTSDNYDPNSDNKNDSNRTVVIVLEADLQVIKLNDLDTNFNELNPTFYIGDIVNWYIKVINNDPNDAINTTAIDLLPVGLIYISDDSNRTFNHKAGIWNIGNLSLCICNFTYYN